jgi:hypothetical protein
VTFFQVHNEPKRYRGEVVRIDGNLWRVLRHEPTLLEQQAGLSDVYEVWILNTKFGRENPACLLCTQLPEGIKVAEEVKHHVPVSFVGYFFKKYGYTARDEKKRKYEVPLVIGYLEYKPKKAASDWTSNLLPVFFGVIAGTLLFVFLLTYFFRRADHRVRTRIDAGAPPFVGAENAPPEKEKPAPEPGPPLEDERRI